MLTLTFQTRILMNKRITLLLLSVLTLSMFASNANPIPVIQNNFTGVIVPQYATPQTPDGNTAIGKLPIYFRATVSNLLPNTVYNYTIKAVLSSTTTGTVTWGVGDMVHVTSGGVVNFVNSVNQMNQATTTFTTDALGNYTGWFGMVQNNDVTFTAGNSILPLIHIGDGTGNDPIYSFLMNSGNAISLRSYNTTATTVSSIYGESNAFSKNMIVLYDNTTASGRPISTTMVESEGTGSATFDANPLWYSTNVDGYVGTYTRWGAIYLNNGSGVKRIEQLSIADGSLVGCATDADGVWPSGTSTIASFNGNASPKFIANTDAPLSTCASPQDVTGVGFTNECFTDATVNWTKPAGYNSGTSDIIVFAKAGSAITIGTPTNNVSTYTASTAFGSGTAYQNDPSAFAIHKGDLNSINLTGLTNNTTYYFLVFNVISGTSYSGGVSFSGTTLNTQPNNVSGLTVVSNNGVLTLDWSAPPGCWDEVLVVAKQASAVTSVPTGDGTLYTESSVFADPNVNSNINLVASEYAVYKGIDTTVVISELINNVVYHFEVFTRKGTVWSNGITITGTPTAVSGDYQTVQNGNWTSISTWEFFNGTSWVAATAYPNSTTTNVTVRTGHTVVLDASARQVRTLIVETGAKLWCNNTAIAYLYVFGPFVTNNGQIGNYPTTNDGISLAIETTIAGGSPNGCVLQGSASASNFALNRLVRRNLSVNNHAVATISTDMYITNSGTGITNLDATNKSFIVAINAGNTVTCLGDVSMDGDGPPNGNSTKHGIISVNGTLTIEGTLYTTTNNVTPNSLVQPSPAYPAGASYRIWVGSTGVLNANTIDATASGLGSFQMVLLQSGFTGGKLNLTGTAGFSVFSLTNNGFTLNQWSTVEYSAAGAQTIRSEFNYQNLLLSGSGIKTPSLTTGTTLTILQNLNITGSSVLAPPAGTQINITGNWTSYGQSGFTEGTSTVYFNSAATQILNTTGGEVFYNLTKNGSTDVMSPAKILLNSDVTVSNVLNLGTGALYAQIDFSSLPHTATLSNMTTPDCFIGGANASISMNANVAHHFYIGCQSPSFVGTMSCSFNSTVHYNRSTGTQTVLGGNNIVYGKLEINNAAGVTLGNNVQLINQLIFTAGKITTNAYYVYVNNSSITSITGYGSTKYVIGNLRRDIASTGTFDLPVGTVANYELAQLIPNGLVGTTYVTASFTSSITGAAPNVVINGVTINTLLNGGIWTITPDVQPVGGTYGLQLYERGYSNPISPAIGQQGYAGLKRPNSAGSWASANTVPTSQLATGGTVSLLNNNLTTFSDFGIGFGNAVLPVTLTAFDAAVHGDDVLLTWHTESELNNAYFDVETSVDGKTFHKIGSVNGHGTTTEAHSYELVHENPATGINYYRLKQVDTDNTTTYSQIRAVEFFANDVDVVIGVYPVPASSELNVTGVEENALVRVYDLSGRLLVSTIGNGGLTSIKLDALSNGLYLVKVENGSDVHTRLFTKQ